MLTLGSLLTDTPELELEVVWPGEPAFPHDVKVTGLVTVSLSQMLGSQPPRRLPAGALVLITAAKPFTIGGRTAAVVQQLLQQMSYDGCAGLVVRVGPAVRQPFPQPIRDLSEACAVPLLTTTARGEQWAAADEAIQKERLVGAEQREAQLDALVDHLPAQLADPKALQRITDWLAQALDGQVLVSEPERVLAASPATAAEHLAQAIIRQSVDDRDPYSPSGPDTQLISLAPNSGADTILAVTRRTPFDASDKRLLRHAVKLLSLVHQATREYRAASDASRASRMAAVELLLDAEVDKARRIMAHLAPGLLEQETARVFVIGTPHAQWDATVRRCETVTAGRALVVADPHEPRQILVIHPLEHGREAEGSVAGDLARLVHALGQDASLGGSGAYSLSLLSEALREARTAQRFAVRQSDSVALSVQNTDLVSLLPQYEAQRWARQLLRPLMHPDAGWEQLRKTLPTALAHPGTVAAQRLDLHRNTVRIRVNRAANLLNMDLTIVRHRIVVGLALELVIQREASRRLTSTSPSPAAPTLDTLLAAPQVRDWADVLLGPARTDQRDLLATATSWLACDTRLEPTARALSMSEFTVRTHLRALEEHMSCNLASLTARRDLHFSLHVMTGKPKITNIGRELCTAA